MSEERIANSFNMEKIAGKNSDITKVRTIDTDEKSIDDSIVYRFSGDRRDIVITDDPQDINEYSCIELALILLDYTIEECSSDDMGVTMIRDYIEHIVRSIKRISEDKANLQKEVFLP